MEQTMEIIRALIKIQERADIFRHGREKIFAGINLAEVHCIDWIGMIADANVTKLAIEMGMTKGAISKICKKLLNKKLIESYQRQDNNKEIYYRLTANGLEAYQAHKACHNKSIQEKLLLLNKYTEPEQAVILQFLRGINKLIDNRIAEQ